MFSRSKPLTLDGTPLSLPVLTAIGAGLLPIAVSEDARKRVEACRRCFDDILAAGAPVYGVNTGVGAMKNWSPGPEEIARFNKDLVRAHAFPVGEALPVPVVRMAMAVRVNVALAGHTGVTPGFVDAYVAWLNAGLTPVAQPIGSLGCGDIGMMGQIGAALGGDGEAFLDGERLPVKEGLAKRNLAPFVFGPKDSIAALSSNASSVALAVAALCRAASLTRTSMAVAITSAAAMKARSDPSESAITLGSERQAQIGSWFSAEFGRMVIPENGTRIHDPLSLRMMPQVIAAACDALQDAAKVAVADTVRNDDNPVILDGRLLSSGGSLPIDLVLAIEKAAIALAHLARSAMNRCILMVNGRIVGLPINLVAPDAVMTGFGPSLKLAGDLFVRILRSAQPVSAEPVVVADGIEDEATFLPLAIDNLSSQLDALGLLIALEALLASAALDVGHRQATGLARMIHDIVREHAAAHICDRPLSPEIAAIAAQLVSEETAGALRAQAPLPEFDAYFAPAETT